MSFSRFSFTPCRLLLSKAFPSQQRNVNNGKRKESPRNVEFSIFNWKNVFTMFAKSDKYGWNEQKRSF